MIIIIISFPTIFYESSLLFFIKEMAVFNCVLFKLPDGWEDKRVHAFAKGISSKVNVIARLEFELVYYDSTVHYVNRYTSEPFSHIFIIIQKNTSATYYIWRFSYLIIFGNGI